MLRQAVNSTAFCDCEVEHEESEVPYTRWTTGRLRGMAMDEHPKGSREHNSKSSLRSTRDNRFERMFRLAKCIIVGLVGSCGSH